MNKKLLISLIGLALVITLNACCTIVPGKVVYSEDLISNIEDMNVVASILVTEEGTLLFYDRRGEALEACELPKPMQSHDQMQEMTHAKKSKESIGETPVCQGLEKGSAVISIKTLPILKTNSENCMTFGPDASGGHYQICW